MLDFINIMTNKVLPRIIGDSLGSKGFEIGHIVLQGDHLPKEDMNFIITLAK